MNSKLNYNNLPIDSEGTESDQISKYTIDIKNFESLHIKKLRKLFKLILNKNVRGC